MKAENRKNYLKKLALLCSVGLLLPVLGGLGSAASADAKASDAPVLTLEAEQGKLSGNASVSGSKVGNIGKNGGTIEGKVTFDKLTIPADGEYLLRLHYYSGSTDRYFNLTTDFGKYKLDCPSTGSFSTVGTIDIHVDLKAEGTLTVGSDWYGPDLDKIEVFETRQFVFPNREYADANLTEWKNGEVTLQADLANGVYSVVRNGKTVLRNVRAEVKIGENIISSDDFVNHTCTHEKDTLTFTHTNHPDFDGTMVQTFTYKEAGYLLTRVTVRSGDGQPISTNYIAPAATYQNSVGIEDGVFLQIPFDNDMWVEPAHVGVKSLQKDTRGYEVMAYYNANTMEGIVLGSVTHDTWKTGITIHGQRGKVMGLTVYGGAADAGTRDNSPHGFVSGEYVESPLLFIGCFADWREGMTAYGKANAEIVPPKESTKDVPFGYNSWGVLQSSVKYSDMIAVSDYIKEHLQDDWSSDGATVYVNIDSYWDFIVHNDPDCNLSLDQALKKFVQHCKKNGQKAGIYFTPFTAWQGSEAELKSARVDGTNYTYYDIAMKKSDGSGLYGKLDGGYALDPTHPGTVERVKRQLNSFIRMGFEYIKLDFMTHGAVEGQHYDPSITTGLQAYNFGMAKIHEICNGKMYVNLSIAPLFPYQYADGRRISCDAFSSLDNTKHVLSYLTACFWEEEIYPYPDPDHLVVANEAEGVARCRVTAGAITGTSFLIGDDLTDVKPNSTKFRRIQKLFGNADVIAVAKLGRAFAPLTVTSGERCADTYWCLEDGTLYLAVFNFESQKAERTLDLSRFADSLPEDVVAKELWSGKAADFGGSNLTFTVKGQDAVLFRIGSPIPEDAPDQPDQPDDEGVQPTPPTAAEPAGKSLLPALLGGIGLAAVAGAVAIIFAVRKKKR